MFLSCFIATNTLMSIHVCTFRMTGKEKRVGGFDLMWDDGPVFAEEAGLDCVNPPSYSTNTFLGMNC